MHFGFFQEKCKPLPGTDGFSPAAPAHLPDTVLPPSSSSSSYGRLLCPPELTKSLAHTLTSHVISSVALFPVIIICIYLHNDCLHVSILHRTKNSTRAKTFCKEKYKLKF
ncbi:hypothetical protein H1C71_001738, partial [Ictidomys tridecemlineatus]